MDSLTPIPVNAPQTLGFNHDFDILWSLVQIVAVATPLVLVTTGWAAKLRRLCEGATGGRWWPTLVLFAALYFLIAAIVALPLSYGLEVMLGPKWGYPARPLGGWLGGRAEGLIWKLVGVVGLLWLPFLLLRQGRRLWWLYAGGIIAVLASGLLVLNQVVINPATAHYEPMAAAGLKTRFLALAERCGAGDVRILVGDRGDATVVGLGPTARILIPTARLTEQTEDELLTTLSHELKHYLLHDNWLALAIVAGLIIGGLLLVDVVGRWMLGRWGGLFGFTSLADPAAFVLAAFILTTAWTFAGSPLFNAVQRKVEIDADRFSLELHRDNQAQAEWQLKLALNPPGGMVDDYPFYRLFRSNHPSQATRVRLANTYRPWESGEPLRFAKVCAGPPP